MKITPYITTNRYLVGEMSFEVVALDGKIKVDIVGSDNETPNFTSIPFESFRPLTLIIAPFLVILLPQELSILLYHQHSIKTINPLKLQYLHLKSNQFYTKGHLTWGVKPYIGPKEGENFVNMIGSFFKLQETRQSR